jgi:hypothetical protein
MISEETRMKWDRYLKTIHDSVESGELDLNPWEEEFIDSISIIRSNRKDLSFKQSSCLTRIYEKVL